jgi:Ca2+-binding EF-hand superfamily protein
MLQLWEALAKKAETSAASSTDTKDSTISELLSSITSDSSDLLASLLESSSGLAQAGQQTKKESSDDVFAKLDKNGDGTISQDEMTAVFGSTDGASKFSAADTDGDGKVTAAELKTAMEKAGQENMQSKMSEDLFAKLDSNSDNSISKDEMTAVFGSTDGASKFSAADTNGDGKVTLDELQAAMEKAGPPPPPPSGASGTSSSSTETVFNSLDTNGDGTISQAELAAFLEQNTTTTSSASDTYSQMQQILAALLQNTVDTTT